MKKSIKKKWLKALRSGEYKQGTGNLRDKDFDGETNFCCLGVLCNIHAQENPEIAARQTSPHSYMGSTGHLPLAVAEWAGLRHNIDNLEEAESYGVDISVTYRDKPTTLITLNDSEELSFKKIANVIERCL